MFKRLTSAFQRSPKNLGNNNNGSNKSSNKPNNKSKNNKSKNNNTKKSKKRKTRKNSVLYFNSKTQKYRPISKNKVFNKDEFQELYGDNQPRFKKVLTANVVVMYDVDAPNGEGERKNKTYVHFLEVDDKPVIKYESPNPYKGVHNYYSVSIRCDDDETLNKLLELNPNDRKPDMLQKLHKDRKLGKFEIKGANLMRISNFKISAETNKNNKNNKGRNNNGLKSTRNTSATNTNSNNMNQTSSNSSNA